MNDIKKLQEELQEILSQFMEQIDSKKNALFVIGCSTSEIIGKKIGTGGTIQVAEMIFQTMNECFRTSKIHLAFQCCEHLNRALVIERAVADRLQLEEVSVIPVPKAGGSMAAYAYQQMNDPVVVEHIKADYGIDIGDTLIGMHLKHVAVPVRVSRNKLGQAHITLAKTRPKLIGGERAVYHQNNDNLTCH